MNLKVFLALAILSVPVSSQTLNVRIVKRQNNETSYNYTIPASSESTTNAKCTEDDDGVTCSARTNGDSTPAKVVSYSVTGATFSLLLPDGRVAVVNCESKRVGSYDQKRSCRQPIKDDIQADFKGKNAKLKWPVSLDGKKSESETFAILAVLDKPSSDFTIEDAPKPDSSAANLLEKATNGDAKAQYGLGVLYANGSGVPLDKSQSVEWFHRSAGQGNVYAQEMLGMDYLSGDGIQQNYIKAYFWLDIASKSSMPEAVSGERAAERDAAAVYLTPDELLHTQNSVNKWIEDNSTKP